jgi:tetratricopeptide (TPR) repeat protein
MQPYDWNIDDAAWAPTPEPWTDEEIFLVSQFAWHLYLQGAVDQAVTMCRGLVALNPANAYALKALAMSLAALCQHAESWECWSRLVALNPADADAIAGRCEAAVNLRQFEAAARDLAQIDQIAPWRADGLRFRLQAATSPHPPR